MNFNDDFTPIIPETPEEPETQETPEVVTTTDIYGSLNTEASPWRETLIEESSADTAEAGFEPEISSESDFVGESDMAGEPEKEKSKAQLKKEAKEAEAAAKAQAKLDAIEAKKLAKENKKAGAAKAKAKGKSKNKYPEKTTINLVMNKTNNDNKTIQIALFVIFLVALAAFVKFGVIDVLGEGFAQRDRYEQYQAQLTELQNANANYDAIREEYSHYGNGYLNDEEKALNDRLEIIRLVEADVMSRANVQSLVIQGNNISLTIDNIRLSTVSGIVKTLEDEAMVSFVTVSTAGTSSSPESSSSTVTATMQIVLNSAGGEQ